MKARSLWRQARHAGLVGQDRAARSRRGGVDGQHGDTMARFDQIDAKLIDGGGLA
jgi:hypothetical protein